MSKQPTLPGFDSAISSPGSAAGRLPCDLPAGPTTDPSGPDRARASRSALPATRPASPMSGTCGPPGSVSSRSANLQSFLANRLQVVLPLVGSTVFAMTWKERVTPSGRPICALRASALSIDDSGCTSWATPTIKGNHNRADLSEKAGDGLTTQARRTVRMVQPWATPMAANVKSGQVSNDLMGKNSRPLQEQAERLTDRRRWPGAAPGIAPNGSDAPTDLGGRLNPEFVRWLMGYPAVWGNCAGMAMPLFLKLPPNSFEP